MSMTEDVKTRHLLGSLAVLGVFVAALASGYPPEPVPWYWQIVLAALLIPGMVAIITPGVWLSARFQKWGWKNSERKAWSVWGVFLFAFMVLIVASSDR